MLSAIRDVLTYRSLVSNLVLKDLKLKYRDSALGALWSLLNPLLLLAVYTLVFKYILHVATEDYAIYLLVGLLPWTFFQTATLASTGSIVFNGGLIQKVAFPRQVLPVATVLSCLAQFLIALFVLLPALLLVSHRSLRWPALLLPVLVLLHVVFTLGIALILSCATTYFRDVAHLTEVALLLLFWLTPVLYPLDLAPRLFRLALTASPLCAFTLAYRDLLFWGRLPGPAVVLCIVLAAAVSLAVGLAVFRRLGPDLAEEI